MKKIIKFFVVSLCFILLFVFVMQILSILGNMGFTSGCVTRYNLDSDKNITNNTQVQDKISLNANGYYEGALDPKSPDSYGKWLKSSVYITPQYRIDEKGQKSNLPITITVSGEVSLCKSYVPINNLQTDHSYPGTDTNQKIEIPRVGYSTNPQKIQTSAGNLSGQNVPQFLPLIFDASIYPDSWRNIVEVENGDKVLLIINRNSTDPNTQPITQNSFQNDPNYGNSPIANCSADTGPIIGKSSPLCGRYPLPSVKGMCSFQQNNSAQSPNALYKINSVHYYYEATIWPIPFANYHDQFSKCDNYYSLSNDLSLAEAKTYCPDYIWNRILGIPIPPSRATMQTQNTYSWMPVKGDVPIIPYSQANERIKWPDDGGSMNCSACSIDPSLGLNQKACNSNGVNQNQIWFTSNNQVGLQYRIADSNNQQFGDINEVGKILTSDPSSPKPYKDAKSSPPYSIYNDIVSANVASTNTQYLQLKFEDGVNPTQGGGYVVNIQHTKCVRNNGIGLAGYDGVSRGQVKYMILNGDEESKTNFNDPNIGTPLGLSKEVSSVALPTDHAGSLWLKIDNKKEDYINSYGNYEVDIAYIIPEAGFLQKILDPILKIFKEKTFDASSKIFKNITCSGFADKSNCTNYIAWVHSLLTIYVIIIGMQFILGMAKFNAYELSIKIIKVIIVAGLINGNTFNLFMNDIYPLITSFMDEIIANMAGYTVEIEKGTSAPFVFIDSLTSRIFFNKAFYAQLLSVFSMGLMGIPFFIIIVYSLILMLTSIIRVISLYLVAIMFIALLICLAPIFITFLLFNQTRYLFDNWVRFTIRYCMEPVLMIGGMIILFQLYEVYIDQVLGHSVCWKCAWPFSLPFTGTDVLGSYGIKAVFCLSWFMPWGYEAGDPSMTISFYDVIVILILAQCSSHYIGFITQASGMLFSQGSTGAPSISGPAAPLSNLLADNYVSNKISSIAKRTSAGQYIGGMRQEFSNLSDKIKIGLKGEDQYGDKTDLRSIKNEISKEFSTELQPYKEKMKSISTGVKEFYNTPFLNKPQYIGKKTIEGAQYVGTKTIEGGAHVVGEILNASSNLGKDIKNDVSKLTKAESYYSRILPLEYIKSPFSTEEQMNHEIKDYLNQERVHLSSAGIDIGTGMVNSKEQITINQKAKRLLDKESKEKFYNKPFEFDKREEKKLYTMENAVEKVRKQEIQKRIDSITTQEKERLNQDPRSSSLSEKDFRSILDKNVLEKFKADNKARLDSLKGKK